MVASRHLGDTVKRIEPETVCQRWLQTAPRRVAEAVCSVCSSRLPSYFPPLSDIPQYTRHFRFTPKLDWRRAFRQARCLLTTSRQVGAALAPSTCGASAARTDAMAAETTSVGWLRNQLLTAPILVDWIHSLLQPAASGDVQIEVELLEPRWRRSRLR